MEEPERQPSWKWAIRLSLLMSCWYEQIDYSATWLESSRRSTLVRCTPLISIFSLSVYLLSDQVSSSYTRCWGSPSIILDQLRYNLLQCLGYRRTGEVWWTPWRILYSRSMRYHYVRRYVTYHLQECAQLASWLGARVWKYSHRPLRQQGGCEGGLLRVSRMVSGLIFYIF